MSALVKIARAEPVALREALDLFAAALFAVLVGFEVVHWSPAQVGLVMALYKAGMAVGAVLVRGAVTPNANAETQAEEAAGHAAVAERDRITTWLNVEAAKAGEGPAVEPGAGRPLRAARPSPVRRPHRA